MAGAGIGTEGTTFQFAITESNWLGKGTRLKTSFNISEEKIKGSFAITDPNYKFSGNVVSLSADISSIDRTKTTGYESDRTGFSLGASFEQYENVWFSPTLTLTNESVSTDADASTNLKKMDGTYTNLDFTYGLILDNRNQKFQPTEGYVTSFKQTLPIIQDSSSIFNEFDLTSYHDLSEDVIASLKFKGKSIHGVDDDVRLTNRIYMPSRSLRGFVRGKVGPKDGTDWVGGNYLLGVSAEAQLPNLLPESYRTDINAYIDTGNLWGVDYSGTVDDSSKIRSSVGIGANVFTPVGPLSFTVSQNLTKASTDVTETFNFALGTSF